MPLVEYKLIKIQEGKQRPPWAKEGGWFHHPTKHTFVAWVEPQPRDWYLPDTVTEFTANTFADRMVEIHNIQPMPDPTANVISAEEMIKIDPQANADPTVYFTSNTQVHDWALTEYNRLLTQYGESTDE